MGSHQGLHFFSVCDGHGLHGKPVSGFLKDNLPAQTMKSINKVGLENFEPNCQAVLKESVLETDRILNSESGIDTFLSGSTMCSMLFDQTKIYTINSGDSRAMMCSYNHDKGVKVQALSVDHKPDLP